MRFSSPMITRMNSARRGSFDARQLLDRQAERPVLVHPRQVVHAVGVGDVLEVSDVLADLLGAAVALAALLAGCSVPPTAGMAFPPLLARGQGSASPSGQRQSPAPAQVACPITPPNQGVPPDAHTASFSSVWYGSADGKLWASGQAHGEWHAGENKVLWWRPGYTLMVDGRRLDAPAPAALCRHPRRLRRRQLPGQRAYLLLPPAAGRLSKPWPRAAICASWSKVEPAVHPAAGGSCELRGRPGRLRPAGHPGDAAAVQPLA